MHSDAAPTGVHSSRIRARRGVLPIGFPALSPMEPNEHQTQYRSRYQTLNSIPQSSSPRGCRPHWIQQVMDPSGPYRFVVILYLTWGNWSSCPKGFENV